jgi:putative redox protein
MSLRVTFRGGYQFDITSRGHTVITDQPAEDGGRDAGMTPVDLFVASLGTCVGYFVARYCARHQIPSEGLSIEADWSYAEQPHRVGAVELRVHVSAQLTPTQEQALLKVAHGCTVHQSLIAPPKVDIQLIGEKIHV